MVPPGGAVLDLACGAGRHTRFFLDRGHPVTAVDRDTSLLGDVTHPALTVVEEDLEGGRPFPLAGSRFAAVVVTRYLHRPLLPDLVAAVAPGGLFVYETFAAGQEAYGRPTNPEFLLNPGELLELVRGELRVVAYEDLTVAEPAPSVIQRICARRAV
jgi:SAM-dependent methyltransferase